MDMLIRQLKAIHRDESGVATTEYLLVLILVGLFCIAIVFALHEELQELYRDVHAGMSNGQVSGGLSADNPVAQN